MKKERITMANFGFEKIKRSNGGEVTQNQLYVTYDQICQCDCPGCRNKGLPQEEMEANRKKLNRVIIKDAEKFRHIIFGGGEPLYQMDHIVEVIQKIKGRRQSPIGKVIRLFKGPEYDEMRFTLTTNGQRELFFDKVNDRCMNCRHFNKIILSRYHDDDSVNDELFRANGTLMTSSDISELCMPLRNKTQLSCLCQKGGIETTEDVLRYIEWAHSLRITDIMFSNYQQDITPEEAKQAGCNANMLAEAQTDLVENKGYSLMDTFVFSAGYKISTYSKNPPMTPLEHLAIALEISVITGISEPNILFGLALPPMGEEDNTTISFREFLTEERMKEEWENARKRTYNYSVMPNGAMYADWSCKNLI